MSESTKEGKSEGATEPTKLWKWVCYGCVHDGLVHGRTREEASPRADRDHRQVSGTCAAPGSSLSLGLERTFLVEPGYGLVGGVR